MAHTEHMTWEPKRARWMKWYKGKMYAINPKKLGCKPTKEDSRSAANSWWQKKQSELDAEPQEKPNSAPYHVAIEGYQKILRWCEANGDNEGAKAASQKIEDLHERLSAPTLAPLAPWEMPYLSLPNRGAQTAVAIPPEKQRKLRLPQHLKAESIPIPGQRMSGAQAEIWADRLGRSTSGPVDRSITYQATRFLSIQKTRAETGEISTDRYNAIMYAVEYFSKWAGEQQVEAITGNLAQSYWQHLLDLIKKEKCSREYARSRLQNFKRFTNWLWEVELLASVPRNLNGLQIELKTGTPKPFPVPEIKKILNDPTVSERTKLYLYLCLNTGAYACDISDLEVDQIDLKTGRITRKRSKTRKDPNVPTVSYKLWPQTLRLLKKYCQPSGRALLNEDGQHLQRKWIKPDTGKPTKVCNITCAFRRAVLKLKLTGNLSQLRKTSATLIFNHPQFTGLSPLFLGHAPRTLAEIRYTPRDLTALDAALDYLAEVYGLKEKSTKPSK